VKVGENFNITFRDNIGVGNLEEGSPFQLGSYREQPIIPVVWSGPDYQGLSHLFVEGDWGGTGIAPRLGNGPNIVADLTRNKDDSFTNLRMIGSGFIDVMIIKGLNFKSTIGGTWFNGYDMNYGMKTYENSENNLTSSLNEFAYYGNDWFWTNQLTFDKVFGQHKIAAIAGYEAIKYGIYREVSASRAGYFSDAVDFRTLTNGANIASANSYNATPTTLVSILGKVDYSFMDKYLISATIRRDGSSRFGPDTRYGVFPSFSAGWRIGDEAFLDGLAWLTDLKIRGSYGTMGNQLAVDPVNQFFLYGGSADQTFYDLNGTGTSSLQGFRPVQLGNPDAKWETNITTNIGFEAALWNNKVSIVFDWYTKQTEDLLYNPELPGTAGNASPPYINIASMSNKGIDFELSYKNNWGDFGFNGSLVFTTINNEITKIAEGVNFFYSGGSRIGSFVRNEVGHAMSSFYGYQVEGLFQSDGEIDAAPAQDGAEPGFFRFANTITDTPADTMIDPGDRRFIGDPNPDFTYGLNLAFTYKNWDLSAFFLGSYGNDIFNWNKWWIDFWPSFQGQKSKDLLYNSWTPERTGASTPKASNHSTFSNNTQAVSYYIEDGSYLRLKNLQLGYTVPESILSKAKIKSLRLYVQGVNLLTFTKYSGMDPELGGADTDFGIDSGNYPTVRQFIFGLNLGL
jgi:TonB-linked SusC/RagA family outer membrane protein